jgi:hypothetical protein
MTATDDSSDYRTVWCRMSFHTICAGALMDSDGPDALVLVVCVCECHGRAA